MSPNSSVHVIPNNQNRDRKRVKVYQLDSEGVWEDKGTGCVAVRDFTWIHVVHEDPLPPSSLNRHDGDPIPLLLKARIRKDADFIRQQDTLIVWTEEDGTDMALSFQEQEGCNDLWTLINDIKKKLAAGVSVPGPDIDALPHSSEEEDNSQDELLRRSGDSYPSLPTPSMGAIKEIEETVFAASKGAYGRNQLSKFILAENYVEKLLPLLEMCEDMESTDELYSLSHIVKMIVFLNEPKIYEYILQDDVFPIIVGMLEYDREYPSAQSSYRQQVSSAQFKQLIPIPDTSVATKITQTYRLQFLRDTALARMLDDSTFAALNSMVFFNQVDIVGWFVGSNGAGEEYLSKVIGVLNEEIEEADGGVTRDEVVLFLHELSTVAKGMQVTLRANYYRMMAKLGLFAIFDYTLGHDNIKIRLAAAAILASILDHDPSLVRSFCLAQVKQKQPQLLISLLITRFLSDPDPGLQSQMCELIRIILETDESALNGPGAALSAISSNDSDTDDFLNLFYEKCMENLVRPVLDLEPQMMESMEPQKASLCVHVCSLLCYIIKSHSYRSKYYVLGSAITAKVILLLRAKDSYVRLAAVRVFRTCFGMKDEFYNRHLLKHDIFSAILQCFKDTNGKYNLLNSACLDIFEFIRKENVKSLITNIVQHHKSMFADVDYVETFKNLVLRYDQNNEGPTVGLGAEDEGSKDAEKTKPDGWAKMDNDEEAYFNEDDDENGAESHSSSSHLVVPTIASSTDAEVGSPATAVSPSTGLFKRSASPLGLVDYEDDDDDDDIFSSRQRALSTPANPVDIPISAAMNIIINTATDSNESGTTVWEGGVALARHLAAESAKKKVDMKGKSCIDLGSGTGIVGIVCAKLGAEVLLTDIDHPAILAILTKNAGQNILSSKSNSNSSDSAINPTLAEAAGTATILPLEWDSPARIPSEIASKGPFDIIVGADVVYSMETVVKLVDTIEALSDRRTDIWIGHEHRDPRVSAHFLELMKEKGFKSRSVKRTNPPSASEGDVDYIGDHVALYRFKGK
ncbi:Platinum sensitivity protein [Chytriomyces hyalinus]|nr:Platinum sensitivity protein [Chytriomyces hyalinus]